MKQRLILFGCSHTATSLNKSFDTNYDVVSYAFNGNSNQKIFDDVYQFLNSHKYREDDILIIQYTYTNRLWWPHKMGGREFSFHSFDIENSGIYHCNEFAAEELVNMYSTYIKYFWNYDTALQTHLMNIDLLKSYLHQNHVKFIHWMYSDGGNTEEWNHGFDKFWEDKDMDDVFSKLNLFNIDGEYRIQKWAKNNNFVDNSDHIGDGGNKILANKLTNEILTFF
jgi:hypothetical protein